MKFALSDIRHDQQGFEILARLVEATAACCFETIEIDMSAVSWVDADMCAPLGAQSPS